MARGSRGEAWRVSFFFVSAGEAWGVSFSSAVSPGEACGVSFFFVSPGEAWGVSFSFAVSSGEAWGEQLHKFKSRNDLPSGASIGRSKTGEYKTAALKEYPPHLCRAIWELIRLHLVCRGFSPDPCETDPVLLERLSVLEAGLGLDHSADHMGPDYHPTAV